MGHRWSSRTSNLSSRLASKLNHSSSEAGRGTEPRKGNKGEPSFSAKAKAMEDAKNLER